MSSTRDDRLQDLIKSPPTIFAPNCWGGITYHHLHLPFMSPLINMHIDHDEYLTLLEDPRYYMEKEPQLLEIYCDPTVPFPFPVADLGGIRLWMNHYRSWDEALAAWHRRVKRIDWQNLFVMFFDEDPVRVERFCSLPYDKKVCFVPWDIKKEHCIPVPYRQQESLIRYPFWEIINNLAIGDFELYDDIALLHDCEYIKTGNIKKEGQQIPDIKR